MNDGITFEEACQQVPQSLTSEQLQNCPGQNFSAPSYIYCGIIAIVVVIAAVVLVIVKVKRSK